MRRSLEVGGLYPLAETQQLSPLERMRQGCSAPRVATARPDAQSGSELLHPLEDFYFGEQVGKRLDQARGQAQ